MYHSTKHSEKTNRQEFCEWTPPVMRCKQSQRHLSVTAKMQPQRQVGGSVRQLYRTSYAVRSAFLAIVLVSCIRLRRSVYQLLSTLVF